MGSISRTSKKTVNQLLTSALFLAIPVLLFLTSLQTIQSRDKAWYGGGYDPEYAYLFNSLNMARFRLVGHVDHPGTTMQVAGGLVLEGAWLADKRGDNLTQAVLSEPEHYIRILNVATAIIGSLALFVLALFLYRRTRNIWYSLLLQLTPFVSAFLLFNGFTRVTQEVMQMVAAFAMATVALIWFFDPQFKASKKYILLFGIISGFGMASKVLFAPLMIIPFILIEPIKSKIKFGVVSLGAFILFTLPIIRLYPNMLYWFYRLFIHSGQYGAGEKAVIDTSKYFSELINLLKINPVLATIFIISVLIMVAFIVKKLIKRGEPFSPMAKLLLAVVLAQAAGYLLVAKQPKAAYLLPYESVVAINVVLMVYLLVSTVGRKWVRSIVSAVIVLSLMGVMIPYGLAQKKELYRTIFNPLWEQTWQAASGSQERTAVISTNPGFSPIPALYFGNAYSNGHYAKDLELIYPDFYIDDQNNDKLLDWSGSAINFKTLYKVYKGQVYHLGTISQSEDFISSMKISSPEFQFQKVYENKYLKIASPHKKDDARRLHLQKMIFCGGEMPPENKNQIAVCDGFSYIGYPDKKKVFSGRKSIKVEPENPFAFAVNPFIAVAGDSISVSVWSSARSEDVKIVLSSVEPEGLYHTSSTETINKDKQWLLLKLNHKISPDEAGKSVKVYVWNKSQSPVWLDNFRMEYYTSLKNSGE